MSASGAGQRVVVSVDEVTVRFGGIVAVDRASIAVPPGEIRGLIGPNGAGKTTLFDTITGIRSPSSGRIVFHGDDITSRSAAWRSRHGMRRTFQRQQPFGWWSVEDNVLAALDYHGGGGGIVADLVGAATRRRRERERRARDHAPRERRPRSVPTNWSVPPTSVESKGSTHHMRELIQLTIAGAAVGAIYSLMASGLVLSYTATGIFNLAYGSIAFCAALLFYELNSGLRWSIVPAFVAVVFVFCPLFGMLLDVAVFRPLAKATDAAKIMATVGLLVALPAIARYIIEGGISTFHWGIPDAKQVTLPPGIFRSPPSRSNLWFDVRVDSNQVVMLVTAVLVAVALWVMMRHTSLGLKMRAVVYEPALAAMRGVNEGMTSRYAWIIGTMLAGLAGVVGAPIIGTLQESTFNLVMFIAAAAAVIGGLRSIPLAFLGGLLIGVAQNLVRRYAPFAQNINGFNNAVPFIVMLVGLLFLARDKTRRGGTVVAQPPPVDWTDDLPAWRKHLPWAIAVAAFFLWTFVFLRHNQAWLGNFTSGLALAVVFMSFVIVTGRGGMVSLAQAAFVTFAAFTTGKVMVEHGWPWLLALALGTAVAMVVGVIVALPALRLGGLPLALATLALGFMCDVLVFKWDWLRQGQSGWRIDRPAFLGIDLDDRTSMIVVLSVVLAALIWLVHNLDRSASGRSIIAVRNSEPAAVTSGLSVPQTKLGIFAISAAVAGFGGVLVATNNGAITDGTFPTQVGLTWLAAVVLFGIRKPQGAILAALTTATATTIWSRGFHPAFFPSFLQWNGLGESTATYVGAAFFGLGAVQLAREPDGIIAITARQNRHRRDRRRASSMAADAVPAST